MHPPSCKMILARFYFAMSQKSVFRIVPIIDNSAKLLDASCLTGKNTVQKSSDSAVNVVSRDKQRLPIDTRHRNGKFAQNLMFLVP